MACFTAATSRDAKFAAAKIWRTRAHWLIESLHGGHVGWQEQYNIFAWKNIFFPEERICIVPAIQHGRHANPPLPIENFCKVRSTLLPTLLQATMTTLSLFKSSRTQHSGVRTPVIGCKWNKKPIKWKEATWPSSLTWTSRRWTYTWTASYKRTTAAPEDPP